MKFFKNKFFIIVLSVTVFAMILTATLSIMGQTDPIKNALNTVATPFRYVGMKIKDSFSGFSRYFNTIEELDRENSELESEIERLEKELADAEAVKEENERLRDYLNVKKTFPDFELLDALIIGTGAENYITVFTLNRGSGDGVKLGMPVITQNGLVGSVCEVGYSWCRVRVLTEASASASAYVSRSGEIGLVEGDISLKGTGNCVLNYLSAEADVQEGDLVYTSGKGSVYPRGILIGRIKSVESNQYLRAKTAVVECAVELEALKYVMIVTDFKIYTEDVPSQEQSE